MAEKEIDSGTFYSGRHGGHGPPCDFKVLDFFPLCAAE